MANKPSDLLKEYQAKRNFAKTQEPAGEVGASREGQGRFVVQKHDATRLHYDFRIELDGVLKSWAVTKGPSNNPADKRLAVRVEDHPLDYGTFEGTIPQDEYGGGTVMLWDEGTWEPIGDPQKGLANGDLKMRLHGQRMTGEYVLVHMKGRDTKRRSGSDRENWLLIKHRDEHARDKDTLTTRFTRSVTTGRDFSAIAKGTKPSKKKTLGPTSKGELSSDLPSFRHPQLATLADSVPSGEGWLFEMKYDGYRCVAAVAGDKVRLFTRNGLDWTEQFSAMVEPLRKLKIGSALLDGEICAFDHKGKTDFSTLKHALQSGGRLEFFVFDLIEADGEDISKTPLLERKKRLEKLLGKLPPKGPVQFSPHVVGHGQKVLDAIAAEGHEGIIAKRADAPYRSERTKSWLKIKCMQRQEFVIGGWRPSEKRRGFASLLVGTYEGDELTYRGRVGTGFSHDLIAELEEKLTSLEAPKSPFAEVAKKISRHAKWVRPELVAEIAYTELTSDGILRHPSFVGLRNDKPSVSVSLEATQSGWGDGEALAQSQGINLTSPDRVVFPVAGKTKADLVAYYGGVAELMLPHIKDRPLSLVRCPQGRAKHCFFQKHDTGGFPPQLKSKLLAEGDGEKEGYFYAADLGALIAGTQMNVLEWHIWGSRFPKIEKPDRLVFDIDPDEGLGFSHVIATAQDIMQRLSDLKLKSYTMLSGGKGVHVVVPLTPRLEWPDVKAFCKAFAQQMAEDVPDRYTANISKARRKGRLFIDYLRNERGSTAIAPWSVRSREGAPVAVPVTWDELPTLKAANIFSLDAAITRAREGDPWPDYFAIKQKLPK